MERSWMRTALALVALLAAGPAWAADTVSGLMQGMDYAEARAAVQQQGWQADTLNPMQKDELQQTLQSYFIVRGFTEVENCLPTGLGTCTARFYDAAGRQLFLFTGEPDENSAKLSSWCLGRRDPDCRAPARR